MKTVLVVDDDSDMRMLAGYVLESAGFAPTLAGDGEEALASLHDGKVPDLVLLDIQMPVTDGWSTLAAIRGDPVTAELPVVITTVKAHPDDQRRGWAAGCDGYVTKPYSVAELGPHLECVLARDPRQRADHRLEQIAAIDRDEA